MEIKRLFKPGQVHVWFAAMKPAKIKNNEFESILSLEERIRAQSFLRDSDRRRFLIRKFILRMLLAEYLRCDPKQVEICIDGNGKPHLTDQTNPYQLNFNESDSDNIVAYAFGIDNHIGIDIEKILPFPDMIELVNHYFTRREKDLIYSCPQDSRLSLFYQLWTRKEAVLKAQGEGLLKGPDSVDVAVARRSGAMNISVTGGSGVETYSVMDVKGPSGFAVALASAGTIGEILIFTLSYSKCMRKLKCHCG